MAVQSIRGFAVAVAWATATAVSASAYAQALPGSADSGRFGQRLENPPDTVSEKPPAPLPESPVFVPEAEPVKGFVLKQIALQGVTAFPLPELEPIYHEYLGHKVNAETLHFIAGRITEHYRSAGYFLSKAVLPEQDVENGVVRIAVVEGYASRVRLDGDALPALQNADRLGMFRRITGKIAEMRPLNGPELERLLLLINDFYGIHASVVIAPLPEEEAEPGAVGMTLRFSEERYGGYVSADNYGSRYTGPWEAIGSISIGRVATAFDSLEVSAVNTAELSELSFLSGRYTLPLTVNGMEAGLFASYSDSAPGYTLKDLDTQSSASSYGISLRQKVIRSRRRNLSVEAQFEGKDSSTDVLNTELYDDRLRILRVGADADLQDDLDGSNRATLRLSQGLDILGASENGSPNLSRAGGRNDFTKVEAQLSRLQQLRGGWQSYGAVSGQYAWSPLLSAEQFGYGGQAFGRAYDPSEITGDQGVAASMELRYEGVPAWYSISFEPFVFYDVGKVWNGASAGGEPLSGSSAGLGMRLWGDNGFSGTVLATIPLTREMQTPLYGNGKNMRLLLQTVYRF